MISWFEIQVPDLEQGRKFFGGVFGWTFKSWMEGYEVAYNSPDNMVCAMHEAPGEAAGRHIHVVFDCEALNLTLEDALSRVTAAGGAIKTGRTRIAPDMGWYATVSDPSGLVFDFSTTRGEGQA